MMQGLRSLTPTDFDMVSESLRNWPTRRRCRTSETRSKRSQSPARSVPLALSQ